jgi:hypothetical protein
MARTGKIARLPLSIREELNHRLRDGEPGSTVLPWLNGLAKVKTVLDAQFGGVEISDQNLTEWRQGGHQDWLKDQTRVEEIKALQEVSLRAAKAAGGNLSKGLLALNVGRIQTALEGFWDGMRDITSTEDGNDKDQAVTKLLSSLTAIRGMELEEQKLDLKRVEVGQKGEVLALEKQKFQRATTELFLKWFDDKRARDIAEGKGTKDTKVAELIQLWFGDMPAGIGPKELRKEGE